MRSYFTGEACCRGHVSERFTGKGTCKACMSEDYRSNIEKKKRYDKVRNIEKAESIKAKRRVYYEKTREDRGKAAAQWVSKNKLKVKAIKKAYKARRRSFEMQGDPTAVIAEWERKVKKYCHWCGRHCESEYHVDHYHPLSKGGVHEVSNLVIACKGCNLRKSAKDPYEFAASIGRLF